jgi:hypothetical protein
MAKAIKHHGLDPSRDGKLAWGSVYRFDDNLVESQFPPEEVSESLPSVTLILLAMELVRRGENMGWIALDGGVGGDPLPERADLIILDLSEVDENSNLDVAVVTVALPKAGVDTAT